MVERPIGDVFADGDDFIMVIERPDYNPKVDTGKMLFNNIYVKITEDNYNACTKCYYFKKSYCKTLPLRGECSNKNRADKTKVIFKLLI